MGLRPHWHHMKRQMKRRKPVCRVPKACRPGPRRGRGGNDPRRSSRPCRLPPVAAVTLREGEGKVWKRSSATRPRCTQTHPQARAGRAETPSPRSTEPEDPPATYRHHVPPLPFAVEPNPLEDGVKCTRGPFCAERMGHRVHETVGTSGVWGTCRGGARVGW